MTSVHNPVRERAYTHPYNWRHRARCRDERYGGEGVDPELFFPVSYEGAWAEARVAEAKAFCRRCPVIADCLRWAIVTGQDEGVWGVTTPDERRALRVAPRDRRRPRERFVDPDNPP